MEDKRFKEQMYEMCTKQFFKCLGPSILAEAEVSFKDGMLLR